MELLTAPSKTSQITEYLRCGIRKGNLVPGSRISSVRELSTQFNVSKRVIGCALEQLEREKLIRREHGSGVFVEVPPLDKELDVCMLLWGVRNEPNNFFDELFKMTYPPFLADGFDFTIRTVLATADDSRVFNREIGLVKENPRIDCLLTNTCYFSGEQITELNKLTCPVLFFGDSSLGSFEDIEFNQISGDNYAMGRSCVRYLHHLGHREMTLLTMSRKCYFYDLFISGVEDQAQELGMDLACYELPEGVHGMDEPYRHEAYVKTVAAATKNEHLERPILLNALDIVRLSKVMADYSGGVRSLPIIRPRFESGHFGSFYRAIFDAIEKLAKFREKVGKIKVDVDFVVEDVTSGQKTLITRNA